MCVPTNVMQRPAGSLDKDTERKAQQPDSPSSSTSSDFGAGDVVQLKNPKALHYGGPKDWVTTGVGKVIVGGARLGYGSEITGGEYLCEVGGRRLWAKEWELSLMFAAPRLPPAEELEQEKKRRQMEREKRVANIEQNHKRSRARLEALKVRQAAAKSPRGDPAGEETEVEPQRKTAPRPGAQAEVAPGLAGELEVRTIARY